MSFLAHQYSSCSRLAPWQAPSHAGEPGDSPVSMRVSSDLLRTPNTWVTWGPKTTKNLCFEWFLYVSIHWSFGNDLWISIFGNTQTAQMDRSWDWNGCWLLSYRLKINAVRATLIYRSQRILINSFISYLWCHLEVFRASITIQKSREHAFPMNSNEIRWSMCVCPIHVNPQVVDGLSYCAI